MTRQVLYVAAPLRPTEAEVRATPRPYEDSSDREIYEAALRANLDRAMRWLAWLRRAFPETTFIAPWIATVLSPDGDDSPTLREAGLVDDCAVIERCDGIVLVGPRISDGMRREMEHGIAFWNGPSTLNRADAVRLWDREFFVYDLTGYTRESGRNADGRTFAQWMLGYQEACTR